MEKKRVREVKRQPTRRIALLVPGMHRSGTSALGGMLVKLGVQEPKSLMVPTRDNPRGYWESTAIMRFHNEVLASAGTRWSDWDRFNPDWMGSAVADDFIARLPEILAQEFGDSNLFLVKDPRICRLLPLWQRVLQDIDISPRFVVPLRDPLEVARSLEARDDFGRNHARLTWLRHVLDTEFDTRGCKRVFVDYADLLANWRAQAHLVSESLDLKWPRWSGAVEAEIDQYLSEGLRHHQTASGTTQGSGSPVTGLTEWVSAGYSALLRISSSDPDEVADATEALDRLRAELNRSSSIYSSVLHESDLRSRKVVSGLSERLGDAEKQCEALTTAQSVCDEREARYKQLLSEEASKYQALQHSFDEQVRGHEAALAELVRRHSTEVEELKRSHSTEVEGLKESHSTELEGLKESYSTEVEELKRSHSEVEESLQKRFAEIAKLTKMVLALEARIDRDRSSHKKVMADADATITWLERELALTQRLVSERQRQLEAVRANPWWKATAKLRRTSVAAIPALDEALRKLPDMEAIKKSELFNREWYLERYPDVRKRKMDPLKHYLRYGAAEGRDPGPGFSTKAYLKRYPDVAASGLNPLVHYVQYGIWESRVARDRVKEA